MMVLLSFLSVFIQMYVKPNESMLFNEESSYYY